MSDTATSTFEPYDHEVLGIIRVQKLLNDRAQAKNHNYKDFEREIRERFAEIGLTVDVNWYTFGYEQADGGVREEQGAAMPEITITGRTENHVMDRDRQVHEAVSNILQLPGEDGWIKTDPETMRRFLGNQRGGGHGHGHKH